MGHWYTARRTVRESSADEDSETMKTNANTNLSVNYLTLTVGLRLATASAPQFGTLQVTSAVQGMQSSARGAVPDNLERAKLLVTEAVSAAEVRASMLADHAVSAQALRPTTPPAGGLASGSGPPVPFLNFVRFRGLTFEHVASEESHYFFLGH